MGVSASDIRLDHHPSSQADRQTCRLGRLQQLLWRSPRREEDDLERPETAPLTIIERVQTLQHLQWLCAWGLL